MNDTNLQTCSELYCLLNYFPQSYIDKLPRKLLELIKQNSDSKYIIQVNTNLPLNAQNISQKTKTILLVLKYNYWSTEIEKQHIAEQLYKNEEIYQKELQELYDPNNLFKNKRDTSSTSTAVIKYKESIFTKIRNWIKRIFKAG